MTDRLPAPLPGFVVELLSVLGQRAKAQQKMERWIENGAALGWLIDPIRRRSTSMNLAASLAVYLEIPSAGRARRRLHPRS
jgi:Uma2 family endonuclease